MTQGRLLQKPFLRRGVLSKSERHCENRVGRLYASNRGFGCKIARCSSMRQPLIGLLLVALAFISGYEIQKLRRPAPLSETPSYSDPLSQQPGTAAPPGSRNAAQVDRIRA